MTHCLLKSSCLLLLSAALVLPAGSAWATSSASSQSVTKAAVDPSSARSVVAKLTKEAAMKQAARYVKLPAGATLNNTSFRSPDTWRPFPEWTFSWMQKDPDHAEEPFYISVSLNADTGELTSLSQNSPSEPGAGANPLTRETARKLAGQFLQQVNPSKAGMTKLYEADLPQPKPPLGAPVFHSFRYVRVVDDVLFPENGVDITVNGQGQITSFYLNWNDQIQFTKPETKISEKEATALFQTETKARLSFHLPWEKQDQEKPPLFLVYRNPFQSYVDPETGKLLTYQLEPAEKTAPAPVSSKRLPSLHSGSPLTQEAAFSLVQKTLKLSGYKLASAYYHESSYRGNRPIWNLQLVLKDKETTGSEKVPQGIYCEVDAQTGDILSYSNDSDLTIQREAKETSKSVEALKENAMDTLRKWSPTIASDLFYTGSEPHSYGRAPDARASYHFQRFINGIQAATGSANIVMDRNSGKVIYYNVDFGKESYPKQLPKHISADQAIKAWSKEAKAELVYVLQPVDEALIKQGKDAPSRTAKLVYRMNITPADQPYSLNAETGEWINEANGKVLVLHRENPTDIAGHPAEKELLLMYQYDALSLKDGKILPELPITRGEMIEMLIITLNQGRVSPMMYESRTASFADVSKSSPYFASVENAVDLGILDKSSKRLNPEEKINRAELADMLVRALGYRKLAEHSELFTSNLTDIADSKLSGPIAIVNALGIITGKNNRFEPGKEVSRADAAVAFSRFLEKRAELKEKNVFPRY